VKQHGYNVGKKRGSSQAYGTSVFEELVINNWK